MAKSNRNSKSSTPVSGSALGVSLPSSVVKEEEEDTKAPKRSWTPSNPVNLEYGSDLEGGGDWSRPLSPTNMSLKRSESPKSEPLASRTPSEPPETPSVPPTPTTTKASTKKPKASTSSGPQLIGHLPIARAEALATFTETQDNWYQYKSLGRSRELLESMTCDCVFDPDNDDPDIACGHYSDCINRLTQVECDPLDCRCGPHCLNQRFQKKTYAPIDIVLTEMKGYGLRIEENIPKDTFIYEYIGDVVNNQSFKKRMRDYASEGIRHFYFMMLQKDEFIDATKNGGIGRFANHSCNPNCYVAKWTVGKYVRMGIFAKRNIKKYEELTFNYNVDRYGHQAQTCHCGEPNCVGFIGGKTQTDISTMDDLYLDALGITDEADLRELKGTKKKKGKKLDDPDFMPTMKPILEKEVPKVLQALSQTTSAKVLVKLLTRIKITENDAAFREIMRLRGFSKIKNVMEDYPENEEILTLSMECMQTWPLIHRNKIDDSQITTPVKACAESENEKLKDLANKLLDYWGTLQTRKAIPKRRVAEDDYNTSRTVYMTLEQDEREIEQPASKRYRLEMLEGEFDHNRPRFKRPNHREYSETWVTVKPPTPDPVKIAEEEATAREERRKADAIAFMQSKEGRDAVIAAAARKARDDALAAAQAKIEAEEKVLREAEAKAARRAEKKKQRKSHHKARTTEQKEAAKEKRLLMLVGKVVVKSMSKHQGAMDRDQFKKYAEELTRIIAEKEKKGSTYREGRLDVLSDEKIVKIKKFTKEYIAKVLRKLEKSKQHKKPSSTVEATALQQPTPSTSSGTPNSADADMDPPPQMTIEEVMGMDPDSGSEDEEDDDADALMQDGDGAPRSAVTYSGKSNDALMEVDSRRDAMDIDVDTTPPHSVNGLDPGPDRNGVALGLEGH